MIFKLTPRFTFVVKIAAIVQLLIMVWRLVAMIGNIPAMRINNIPLYIFTSALAVLMPLYIIAALKFFAEKMVIVIAFIVFTIVKVMATIVSLGMFYANVHYNLVFSGVLGGIAFLASAFIFVVSLIIKSKVIMGPIIIFTTCLLVLICLDVLIPIILPLLLDKMGMGRFFASGMMRSDVSILSVAGPIAIIFLTNRIEQFSVKEQEEPEL